MVVFTYRLTTQKGKEKVLKSSENGLKSSSMWRALKDLKKKKKRTNNSSFFRVGMDLRQHKNFSKNLNGHNSPNSLNQLQSCMS